MLRYVRVATLADIPPGTAKAVVVDGRDLALFNVAGRVYATEGTCPHQGGPLAEGWLDGALVTCPWHAWRFDVRTGKMAIAGPFSELETFDVRVDGTDVVVSSESLRSGERAGGRE